MKRPAVSLVCLLASLAVAAPGGASETPAPATGGAVVVRFEGGDVNTELALAVEALRALDLLPTEPYPVGARGAWQAIVERTGLPRTFPPDMKRVLAALNPDIKDLDKVGAGDAVIFVRADALAKVPVRRHFKAESEAAQQRREAISKHWKDLIVEEKGTTGIELEGYRLTIAVGDAAAGRDAVEAIFKGSRGNAFPRYRPDATPSIGPYYADLAPEQYWSDPSNQQSGSGHQALVGAYVGANQLPPCARTPCLGAECPDVMLVDSAVYRHWDVAAALRLGSETNDVAPNGTRVQRDAAPDVTPAQHGTYMLGLIAARDDNQAGHIGVHPTALVTAYDWDRYRLDPDQFVQAMWPHEDAGSNRLEVYVFATSWNVALGQPGAGVEIDDPTLRYRHDVARAIVGDTGRRCTGTNALWVVAAGQGDAVLNPALGLGKDIAPRRFGRGPMNLGDCPNVLVVTACDRCSADDLTLVPRVNYSTCNGEICENGVHVAARGRDVVSTVPIVSTPAAPHFEARYASGNGTSPATALTAGVVSAMASCYPGPFKEPWRVKERVQATSRPVFGGPHKDTFSTGVVDGRAALLDPSLTHVSDSNGGARAVELLRWCVAAIEFKPDPARAARQVGLVGTDRLLRLTRAAVNADNWISYSRDEPGDRRGRVQVHGPSRLGPPASPGGALAMVREVTTARGGTWDGIGQPAETVITLDGVMDLLPQVPLVAAVGPCA